MLKSMHPPHPTADAPAPDLYEQHRVRPWPRWFAPLLVVGVTVLECLRLFVFPLLDERVFSGDARQHVWWTYRFGDPELFPNDLMYAYFSLPNIMPFGLAWLYRLFVPHMDAMLFSELMPFVLAPPTVLLAYLIGRRAGHGALGGLVALVMLVYTNQMNDLGGGHARSFATPLMFLATWAMLARNGLWLGIALVLGAMVYPPTVVVVGAAAAVIVPIRLVQERRLYKWWPVMVVLGLLSLAILFYVTKTPMPEGFGPQTSGEQARQMAEFGEGGRNVFFHKKWTTYLFYGPRSSIKTEPEGVAMMLALIAAGWYFFRKWGPLEAWAFAITSTILFIAAHLTLFALYLPSRYTKYSYPLFAMIWMAWFVPKIVPNLLVFPRWSDLLRRASHPFVRFALLAVVMFGLGAITYRFAKAEQWTRANHPLVFPAGLPATLDYLETLPKDTLVAGYPDDVDNVPLFTKRSALVNSEVALAYHYGFYQQVAERLRDALRATYASDWAEVDALHEKYGVDVFVVNRQRFEEGGRRYNAPFDKLVSEQVAKAEATGGFVLQNPPEDRVLFRDKLFTVVRVGPVNPAIQAATD